MPKDGTKLELLPDVPLKRRKRRKDRRRKGAYVPRDTRQEVKSTHPRNKRLDDGPNPFTRR